LFGDFEGFHIAADHFQLILQFCDLSAITHDDTKPASASFINFSASC